MTIDHLKTTKIINLDTKLRNLLNINHVSTIKLPGWYPIPFRKLHVNNVSVEKRTPLNPFYQIILEFRETSDVRMIYRLTYVGMRIRNKLVKNIGKRNVRHFIAHSIVLFSNNLLTFHAGF